MSQHPHLASLTAFLPVAGDPEELRDIFSQDAHLWLPDGRQLSEERSAVVVHGADSARTVVVTVGQPWTAGRTLWRALSWEAFGDADSRRDVVAVPSTLDAEIGLYTAADAASLVLDGRYPLPPRQRIGTEELSSLQRVAQSAANRFLEEVVARLSAIAEERTPVTVG